MTRDEAISQALRALARLRDELTITIQSADDMSTRGLLIGLSERIATMADRLERKRSVGPR